MSQSRNGLFTENNLNRLTNEASDYHSRTGQFVLFAPTSSLVPGIPEPLRFSSRSQAGFKPIALTEHFDPVSASSFTPRTDYSFHSSTFSAPSFLLGSSALHDGRLISGLVEGIKIRSELPIHLMHGLPESAIGRFTAPLGHFTYSINRLNIEYQMTRRSLSPLTKASLPIHMGSLGDYPKAEISVSRGQYGRAINVIVEDFSERSHLSREVGKNLTRFGTAMIGVSATTFAYQVATSDNPAQTAVKESLSMAGGIAGGMAAAKGALPFCSTLTPVPALICEGGATITGAVVGSGITRWTYEKLMGEKDSEEKADKVAQTKATSRTVLPVSSQAKSGDVCKGISVTPDGRYLNPPSEVCPRLAVISFDTCRIPERILTECREAPVGYVRSTSMLFTTKPNPTHLLHAKDDSSTVLTAADQARLSQIERRYR